MFSAWNPERDVANLLLRNSAISRVKECLFEQSLRGLVNSQWHLKAFVDTAVLIWKEWLPINRILKWTAERQRLLGCERSDSHERRLLQVLKLTALHLYLMLLRGWHVQREDFIWVRGEIQAHLHSGLPLIRGSSACRGAYIPDTCQN